MASPAWLTGIARSAYGWPGVCTVLGDALAGTLAVIALFSGPHGVRDWAKVGCSTTQKPLKV